MQPCCGIVINEFALLLHPHHKGQNNTGFLTGTNNARAGADDTEISIFLPMNHTRSAAAAVFSRRILLVLVQPGSTDRIAKDNRGSNNRGNSLPSFSPDFLSKELYSVSTLL